MRGTQHPSSHNAVSRLQLWSQSTSQVPAGALLPADESLTRAFPYWGLTTGVEPTCRTGSVSAQGSHRG